jgi:hypothetical protein
LVSFLDGSMLSCITLSGAFRSGLYSENKALAVCKRPVVYIVKKQGSGGINRGIIDYGTVF